MLRVRCASVYGLEGYVGLYNIQKNERFYLNLVHDVLQNALGFDTFIQLVYL